MAFGGGTALMVCTASDGGDDTNNGGGFNPTNTNMASDLTTDTNTGNTASPVVSSASYNFVAGDVGYRLFIRSGTNWRPGWYTIASVASNKATLTASIGSATLYDGSGGNARGLNTSVGVASVGTPTSGSWSIDYSYKPGGSAGTYGSPRATGTDLAVGGTNTNCTSASGAIGKNWVGNFLNVTAGTGFTVQRVEIVSTSGATATADKTFGGTSLSGGTWTLGGSLATPGAAASIATGVGGVDIHIRQGTYTTTSSSANVAGGRIAISTNNSAANPGIIEGFGSIPKDRGTRPIYQVGTGSALTLLSLTGTYFAIRNLKIDGASGTTISGVTLTGGRALAEYVEVVNCTSTAWNANLASLYKCSATGCSGTIFDVTNTTLHGCEAYSNTASGFLYSSTCAFINCLSYSNSGASSDGFRSNSNVFSTILSGCLAYGNGRAGFMSQNNGSELFVNCISEGHTSSYEFTSANSSMAILLVNCAGYQSSGSGVVNTSNIVNPAINFQTGTGTFFTNAAAGDFSLNNTAGQGALCRAAGFPGVTPRGTSTGYVDIGPIQHADPVASSGGSYASC